MKNPPPLPPTDAAPADARDDLARPVRAEVGVDECGDALAAERVDGFALLERAEAEAGHLPAVHRLLDAVRRWARDEQAGHAAPLPAYLHLPTTGARQRHFLRDAAVRDAARHVDAAGPWRTALAVEAAWLEFSRSAWISTMDRSEPPDDERLRSKLRRALWWATKHNGGAALSARRIDEILRGPFATS